MISMVELNFRQCWHAKKTNCKLCWASKRRRSPCSRAVCVLVMQAEGQRFNPHSSRKIFLTISVSRDENVPPFIKNGTAPAGSDWKLSPVGLTHHRSTISRPKRVPKRDGLLDITPFCVMPIAYFFFLNKNTTFFVSNLNEFK